MKLLSRYVYSVDLLLLCSSKLYASKIAVRESNCS